MNFVCWALIAAEHHGDEKESNVVGVSCNLKCPSESTYFGIRNSPCPLIFPKVNLRKDVMNAKWSDKLT